MKKLPIEYIIARKNYFLFKQDIGVTHSLRTGKRWEEHLYDAIKHINFKNSIIIDIGANLGSHTLEFADLVGDNGKVYAFEPQRIIYYQLCSNIIANGYNNIFAYNLALSDKNETAYIEKQNFYSDDILNIGDTHISNDGDIIDVKKLDNYNLNNVSLIKIDVQGYEPFVLNGAIETIKRNKPIILIEIVNEHLNIYNKSDENIKEFFSNINYNLNNISGWDYIATPKIEHIYQNIDGWFDFESTYKEMVENANNNAHFVEVGAWLGKSASYMAVEIANSGKNIKFDVVDTWEGSINEIAHKDSISKLDTTLYDAFLNNISPVNKYITPIKGLSENIADLYTDESLDFVFLDASHDYEFIKKDIEKWFPKIKNNGVIAGHDYNEIGTEGVVWDGVVRAVNEYFDKDNIIVRKVHAGTWIVYKEKINKIKHIYQNIDGWFDFDDIYSEMVKKHNNALFVEIGAAWGKSSSYMAVEIANSKKNIKFDVIDKWEDENGSFYEKYLNNVNSILKYINPIKGYSTDVVNNYLDNSIDFLFIDASHKYEDVLNDINLWYHKVKHNGIIAGHDYNLYDFPDVFNAVNDFFGKDNIKISKWSWVYEKKITTIPPEHGRGGFIPAINYIKNNNIYNPIIIEIGTQREFNNTGDGSSTTFFSWFVNTYNGEFYSIDIESDYIENGRIELKNKGLLTNRVHLICDDGMRFIEKFNKKINLLYLDGWDYRGTDYEKKLSEEKHLECFMKSEKLLTDNSLILIDDVINQDTFEGKGHLLIPYLIKNNYNIILKEWQFLFSKNNSNIIYLSGGLLGDFINQLSIINENYILTGKKGILYLVENFPMGIQYDANNPRHNIGWRFGINKIYDEIKDIILQQEYILDFKIYNNEVLDNYIHLSQWRLSSLLHKTTFYEIFKSEYNVEWGKHKWLNLPINDKYKDYILITTSERRYNFNFNFNFLKNYNKKIYFATTDINEYNNFKKISNINYELLYFDNLLDYWIAINSCYLFVSNLSSFSSIAMALNINNITLLATEDSIHFKNLQNLKWFKSKDENNLEYYDDNKILVCSCCFNEEKMLPFYLDYYTNFINADILIYDGGSTDRSHEIIAEYNNVKLIIDKQDKLDDRYLNDIRNNAWKSSRNEYDWIIVCDIDEFIYHPELRRKLIEYDKNGITIPLTEGFDMMSEFFPKFERGKYIFDLIQRGIPDPVFLNKKSLFKSSININYHIGSHGCEPIGDVKYNNQADIKILHFKWISNDYLIKRSAKVADRLSDWNLSGGCGSHNRLFSLTKISDFNKRYSETVIVLDKYKLKKTEYKISVLIPTYNRFNLLKEAIESVLNQNYKNIEILVCHDGKSLEYEKFKNDNKYDNVKYIETTERKNNYGATSRNLMLTQCDGDFILHLDDDNILYDGYLQKMVNEIDEKTGMVICKIHYNDKEWCNYILPRTNKIQACEIDQLSILFNSKFAKLFEWDDYFGHDHRYITSCEKEIIEQNLKIKYIPDILANHRFFGEIKPRIALIHHCYLRYNWEKILKEQIFLIKESYLYDSCNEIYATIYADDKTNYIKFKEIIDSEDYLKKWNLIILDNNNYEFDTLKFIKKYSEDKHAYICYFHLKGVISEQIEPNIGVPTWRDYLNYFTITKWKDNIKKLNDNDVVCVDWNYNDMHQRFVLGGHFFWTKTEYIRTLSEPIYDNNRFLSEIWITSNDDVKVFENFNYEKVGYKNLYLEKFPQLVYKDIKKSISDIVEYSFKYYKIQQNKWEYIEFLNKIISKNKTKSILEIGSKYGGTTYGFCNIFDKVVTIDTHKEIEIIQLEKEFKNLNFILGDTRDKIKELLNDMKFDVIYIDGEHSYNSVKQDYLDYKEFVSDDGIIVFHDIKRTWWTDEIKIEVPILWEEIKNNYIYEELINNENDCYGIGLLYKKNNINENNVIIMTAHPNYKTSEDITQQAIESLKLLNTDIILSCHSPMSLELQNAVKYVIFDKNNPIIKHDYYDHSWFDRKEFYAFINLHKNDNDLQHALAVYLNYYNGILYAKNLGYKTAICTNFDIIFDRDDLSIITEKIDKMNKTGKKSFFLTSNANEGIHYKTIFFITDVDFFIDNFKYVINEIDYNKLTRKVGSETNCLENFFYQTLKNSDKLLLQEINENDLFSKSKVNLFSNIEYFTVLPERHKSDNFVIWFSSANSLDDNRNICISVTDNTDSIYLKNDIITKNYIFYKSFVFEKNHEYKITCQITYDDIVKEKLIIIDNQAFDKINDNGDFWNKINYL